METPNEQQPDAPEHAPAPPPVPEEACWREFWDVLTDALAHADPPPTGDHGEAA